MAAFAPELIKFGTGIVATIFGGMAKRAAQARNENSAVQLMVPKFDSAIAQIAQQYNAGSLSQQDALSEVNQIWNAYWQSVQPAIQPNRNGCGSGGNCPGTATTYAATNGVPAGFCAGNNGAACCVGCGPIRLSIENVVSVLEAGSGTAHIAPIGGDHYGLQTRLGYDVVFKSSPLSVFSGVNQAIDSALGLNPAAQLTPTGAPTSNRSLVIAGVAAVALLFGAVLFGRR